MTGPFAAGRFGYKPATVVEKLFAGDRRVLLFGQPGIGKTTLAAGLAAQLLADRRHVWGLGADPGSPVFGVPGAVCLGIWREQGWSLRRMAGLCSLDAARFRLPLVSAVRALAEEVSDGVLLLDAPGVCRGIAGAELLTSLVQAADIDLVLALLRRDAPPLLADEMETLGVELACIEASEKAHRPGGGELGHVG